MGPVIEPCETSRALSAHCSELQYPELQTTCGTFLLDPVSIHVGELVVL